jgi:cell wall-associated NlpC family hydrolase
MSGFFCDRVLNFHYGFNSYIQAKRIESILAQKMNIVGTSKEQVACGGVETPIEGDATLGATIARRGEKYVGIPYELSTPKVTIITPGSYNPKTGQHIRGVFKGSLDCSYFTQIVFKEFNLNLPRTTREQVKSDNLVLVSEKLDFSKMQKGDLIYFWGSYGQYAGVYASYSNPSSAPLSVKITNTSHVGIYYGDGMMIHTGNNRKRVFVEKIPNYWVDRLVAVKRHKGMTKGAK